MIVLVSTARCWQSFPSFVFLRGGDLPRFIANRLGAVACPLSANGEH
jgi:hypothetical protein